MLRSALWGGAGVAGGHLLAGCGTDVGDRRQPALTAPEVASVAVQRNAGSPADVPDVVAGIQAFTADLYAELAAEPGNLVVSPYSVAVALAMPRNGARGQTANEMDSVLRAPPTAHLNGGMNALIQLLESRAGIHQRYDGKNGTVALDAANSLWGQRGTAWQPTFLDVLARSYGAGMQLVDYFADADGARHLINDWTSDMTRGKVPELVPDGVLDGMTRLVLVNAIYLKAPWEEPFDERTTRRRPFRLDSGSTIEVDMMTSDVLQHAAYATGPGWRAARLPYVGGAVAMAVVVPDHGIGIGKVEESLHGDGLARLLASFRPIPGLSVEMPRWSFSAAARLDETLIDLGMPTAFDDLRADFSGMTTEVRLFIDAVLHEAFVAVDEEGTEAAAATAVEMAWVSAHLASAELIADRPFLFVIVDIETETPLFIGRVADPRS